MSAQLTGARCLFSALADAGVREVVISPGSRSTPLVLAALAEPRLRIHDLVDERSAAFFALGQARITGRPTLCIATSGTAGAHYLPAAIEAAHAHLPLLLLTADRPLELQHCGAAQTIDQRALFGTHARASFELPLGDSAATTRALARIAAEAVTTALHPQPGAVHLNAGAKKPLEPEHGQFAAAITHPRAANVARPRLLPDEDAIRALAEACRRAERGLIVLGPDAAPNARAQQAILDLARALAFPVLAEAPSQLRFVDPARLEGVAMIDRFEPLLRSPAFREAHAPDLILGFGKTPTSSGFDAYVAAHRSTPHTIISPYGWSDPDSSASSLILADTGETAAALTAELAPRRRDTANAWTERLLAANRIAEDAIDRELQAFGEGAIAREAVRASPRGTTVMAGNGLPIRHLDLFCAAGLADVRVLAQRGTSGIDGLVSGAAGSASITAAPLTLLIGDVSLLHDLGGLAAAARTKTPLPIVVLHNGGGRIFEQLPLAKLPEGELPPRALEHFTTPHALSFRGAAEMFGIAHHTVTSTPALTEALARAHQTEGPTIIEARVAPHDARDSYQRIQTAVDRRFDDARRSKS